MAHHRVEGAPELGCGRGMALSASERFDLRAGTQSVEAHNEKRVIEGKVFELREKLEAKGKDEAEIERKCRQ